ncbi:MAG TPA: 3D domain-containing protein [Clostridiales bacterium]|nr:3D domain-containing protein [Clostridiales bacterium]
MHFIKKSFFDKVIFGKNLIGRGIREIIDEMGIKLLFKVVSIIIAVSVVTAFAGAEVLKAPVKTVSINDDGSIVILKTKGETIEEALQQNGINVKKEDYVYPSGEQKLISWKNNEILIKRATPVSIYVDGKEEQILTQMNTVKGVLEANQIAFSESDLLEGANIEDTVFPGMKFRIIRIKEDLITEKEAISFKVEKRPSQRMEQGVEKTVRDGKEGVKEYLYRVVYEDGEIKTKELVKESIAMVPIDKVVEYGTIATGTTSRGEKFRYKKVIDARATAYTASFKDTGKNPDHPYFGITYTGVKVKKGIIAVDPKVIPLGSRVYIEGIGKTPDYGYALAADIGGGVKGNMVDLYMDTQKEADNWGIRKVKVYILAD